MQVLYTRSSVGLEHGAFNSRVVGSNPTGCTSLKRSKMSEDKKKMIKLKSGITLVQSEDDPDKYHAYETPEALERFRSQIKDIK